MLACVPSGEASLAFLRGREGTKKGRREAGRRRAAAPSSLFFSFFSFSKGRLRLWLEWDGSVGLGGEERVGEWRHASSRG